MTNLHRLLLQFSNRLLLQFSKFAKNMCIIITNDKKNVLLLQSM